MIDFLMTIDWLLACNRAIPVMGLIISVTGLFCRQWSTTGKTSSTILHLSVVLWTLLLWADWGSLVFTPSHQSVLARLLVMFVIWLFLVYIRHQTIRRKRYEQKLSKLNAEIMRLKHNK